MIVRHVIHVNILDLLQIKKSCGEKKTCCWYMYLKFWPSCLSSWVCPLCAECTPMCWVYPLCAVTFSWGGGRVPHWLAMLAGVFILLAGPPKSDKLKG